MRVTVLGSSASYAGAGQACAGHLVEGGGARVLMDCGHGVLANLGRAIDPLTLDAIVITHAHVDHFVDLYALTALLRYAPQGPAAPLRLHAPQGLLERMGCLLSKSGRHELTEAFDVHTLEDGATARIAELAVTARRVDHVDPTYALIAEADGKRMCYTSDTGLGDEVISAARGSSLLLAEATLPERYADAVPHLTARQAGEIARDAGAKKLVLVHLWPTNDRAVARAEAEEVFDGDVAVADEMDVFDVA